jgi:DNA-directed RNA polymerase subunit RPC12/RpoP
MARTPKVRVWIWKCLICGAETSAHFQYIGPYPPHYCSNCGSEHWLKSRERDA